MMTCMIRFLPVTALLLFVSHNHGAQALSLKNTPQQSQSQQNAAAMNRRQALSSGVAAAALGLATVFTGSSPALAAAATPPTPEELKRIQVGYQQITNLLNNFEEATTTCRENGGECKRDAEPIRE